MARRRQSNPSGNTGLLLAAGAAGVAYYLYTKGYFSTTTLAVTPAGTAATKTGNPISSGAAVVNTPVSAPALGTVITTGNQLAAAISAKQAYIIPDPAQLSAFGATLASAGYVNYTINIAADASDANPVLQTIYLRPDVATPEQTLNATRAARKGSVVYDRMTDIQSTMAANGLSGLSAFGGGW